MVNFLISYQISYQIYNCVIIIRLQNTIQKNCPFSDSKCTVSIHFFESLKLFTLDFSAAENSICFDDQHSLFIHLKTRLGTIIYKITKYLRCLP